jgi:hypothetical protein
VDERLEEARRVPLAEVVERLAIGGLKRSADELVGPCPASGGCDRFSVSPAKRVWNCRKCGGGDGIALVRHVLGCDHAGAIAWLVGEREIELSPEARARREAARAAERKRQEAEARRRRFEAIEEARGIWGRARPAEGTAVRGYLELRGIALGLLPELPQTLRYIADHPYVRTVGGGAREWHRGPAMIACVQAPNGRVVAVHQTWIDLDQPNGKARIMAHGEAQPAKLVRGVKKGCAIRLGGDEPAAMEVPTLVMGEGIETTLSARVGCPFPARFWAGVDLGNMAGRRRLGAGLLYAGIPEMHDLDAFVPPAWVKRLIYIQDGDSERRLTRAKLEAGLRRAMALRPGLAARIVDAGRGVDMNDVLLGRAVGQQEGAA